MEDLSLIKDTNWLNLLDIYECGRFHFHQTEETMRQENLNKRKIEFHSVTYTGHSQKSVQKGHAVN